MTSHCLMDFSWYPFDAHDCFMSMILEGQEGIIVKSNGGVTEPKGHWNPNWNIVQYPEELNGQIYSYKISLKRHIKGILTSMIIPSLALCLVSTISLFIPYHLIPARASFCFSTWLSFITLVNGQM